jgi:hypothetical protein
MLSGGFEEQPTVWAIIKPFPIWQASNHGPATHHFWVISWADNSFACAKLAWRYACDGFPISHYINRDVRNHDQISPK